MSFFQLALCCSMLLSLVAPAFGHTVALVRPPQHSASTTELLERLRGELLSLGYDVTLRDRSPGSEGAVGMPWQRTLIGEDEVDAAIDVLADAEPVVVNVWIIDRARQFHLVSQLALETNTENSSKRLAIRASEVLRARLTEARSAPSELAGATAPSGATSAANTKTVSSEKPRRLGLEVGAAALTSLDGVGPAIMPLALVDWSLGSHLLVQAALAGFGTRAVVTTAAGKARVASQYGLLGAGYRAPWKTWLTPLGTLSVGALRTAVEGQANSPREGHSLDQWSFLVDASLGAAVELTRHYSLTLATHAQLAQPYVAIRFADQRVAALGRPNLSLTLTFGVWP